MRTIDIARNVFEQYKRIYAVENYFGLLALYGASQLAVEFNDSFLLDEVETMLADYPGNINKQPIFNFESYKCGGNGKAYLTYLDSIGKIALKKDNRTAFRSELKEYADKMIVTNRNEDGIMTGSMEHLKTKVWIDAVTCITPFMLFAGLALGDEKYIDCGAEQCIKMYNLFVDNENGLLHQGKGFCGDEKKISEDHWSRGNGWGYVGLADLVSYLPRNSKYCKTAAGLFKKMTDALYSVQYAGVWNQELTYKNSWHESSGTALILYGIGSGIKAGILGDEYKKGYIDGMKKLINDFITPDFSILSSCPSCLCPGSGSKDDYVMLRQPMKNEPHSFGAVIMALVQAHRNGITLSEEIL